VFTTRTADLYFAWLLPSYLRSVRSLKLNSQRPHGYYIATAFRTYCFSFFGAKPGALALDLFGINTPLDKQLFMWLVTTTTNNLLDHPVVCSAVLNILHFVCAFFQQLNHGICTAKKCLFCITV
jgi:hypothetical protein